MGEMLAENWKIIPGLLLGAFVVGLIAMVFISDGIRKWLLKWLLNGDWQRPCSILAKGDTPLSKEDHDLFCGKKWLDHDKLSTERWIHNQEIAKKDRELLLSEVEHLKAGQAKMGETVDRIFEKLDRR